MWTEEKIKEVAAQYTKQLMEYYNIPMIEFTADNCQTYNRDDYQVFNYVDIKKAFVAGARYIINSTQS